VREVGRNYPALSPALTNNFVSPIKPFLMCIVSTVTIRKLQAVRFRLSDGQSHMFFGPAVVPEDDADNVIESIVFSNHFECESTLSVSDLWLLVQNDGVRH